MNKYILFLFGIILFSNKSVSQSSQNKNQFNLEETKKILSREINKILKETGIPSISFALIKGDSIVWSDAFGYTNVKKQVSATTSTIYNTGSNFKFVTATAIMQLAEDGKLNIDDPINKYLEDLSNDEFSKYNNPVTFRHLLSHHSGLKGPLFESIPVWERRSSRLLKTIASKMTSKYPPEKKWNTLILVMGF